MKPVHKERHFLNSNILIYDIAMLLYKVVLDIAYISFIYPTYNYIGFIYDLSGIKLVESYLLLFIVYRLIPRARIRPSHIIMSLFTIIAYIPMLTIYAMMNQPREYMYAVTLFIIFILLLVRFPVVRINPIKNIQNRFLNYTLLIIISLNVLCTCIILFKTVGSLSFDIYKVYEIRSLNKYIDIGLMRYVINWTCYILNPLLIGYFLVNKRWISLSLVITIQILLFSLTGTKTYLMLIPFCMAMVFLVRSKNWLSYFVVGITFLLFIGTFIEPSFMGDVFVRRAFFIPALISFNYYDYFSHLEPLYLSAHHIFNTLVTYPYDVGPTYLIGQAYLYHNVNTNADTGILADAFINFGFWGFLIWGMLLGFICHLIDSVSAGKDVRIVTSGICGLTITLTESALLTALITGGILFAIFVIYLLPVTRRQHFLPYNYVQRRIIE